MTDAEFNAQATDGDNDGIVQEGTPFERPIEEVATIPTEEVVAEELVEEPAETVVTNNVVKAEEPEEEKPALTSVNDGVIGAGSVKVKKSAEKKSTAAASSDKKAALFSEKNVFWQGLGRLKRGYNIVEEDLASKWTTLSYVRAATPEEIKANLG